MLSICARTVVNPVRRIRTIASEINPLKRSQPNCSAESLRDFSKLSYFHNPGKEPLLTWTAGDVIDKAADFFGDTTGIVYPHQNISKTYAEYKKDVDQLAASLVSLKLPVGSRVAILAPRLYEGAQLLYAASKAGLVMREIMCLNSDLIYGFGRTLGVLAATMFGSTVVTPGARYSPKSILDSITEHRCTIITGSTFIFFEVLRELEEGAYDVSSVRKAIMSGSLCNPAIVEKMRTRMNAQAVYIMYGATETSPIFSSTNPAEPTDCWIRTIGRPLDHVEVKVVDAEGRIVPVNTAGELCTRGPHVFKGYLNDEAKTNEAIRDNWYHTGDEATMDEDGRLTFVGRVKEMINYMGMKVSPLEIENVLNSHPDVEEAQVIGIPNEQMGEKICVCIKMKLDKTLTPEDIKSFCEDKELPWYKVPEFVLFVDSFPRTQTGKVQKPEMREESKKLLNL